MDFIITEHGEIILKTTNLIVAIDSEKLAALQQYAAKKDVCVSDELVDAMERLYEKIVPAAVREYLESKPELPPSRPSRSRGNT